MTAPIPRERLERYAAAVKEMRRREEKRRCEGSLLQFVKTAWPSIENAPYQDSWAIEALCLHLERVNSGDIKRLLVNFPPRCGKSNIVSVCWTVWTWIQERRSFTSGPQVKFLCGSYSHGLSLQLSNKARRLVQSPWFQSHWGDVFALTDDQNAKHQFDNDKGGSRVALSVGGTLIGIGGDILICDDPHNTEDVESEAERETVLTWWKELSGTRLNDPRRTAIVAVMQRLHAEDVSGIILDGPDADDWVHLMLPMEHDEARHCQTVLSYDEDGEPAEVWEDPRTDPGELLWPDRFDARAVASLKAKLGPYMASGRLQQEPAPKGGGIIQRSWWQLWESPDGRFPPLSLVVASADTAYTEKEENDPTGFTIWGLWLDNGQPKLVLLNAWEKRLNLHGEDIPRLPNETNTAYERRAMPKWGLCEWIVHSCRKFKADIVLIENKATGISVAQELARLHASEPWQVILNNPEGDKVARAYAVQSIFSQGLVYAPERTWAELAIARSEQFPKGKRDIVDSITQCLKWLRERGLLIRKEEHLANELEKARLRPAQEPIYDV